MDRNRREKIETGNHASGTRSGLVQTGHPVRDEYLAPQSRDPSYYWGQMGTYCVHALSSRDKQGQTNER